MLSQLFKLCLLFLLLPGASLPVLAGDDAPAWLRQAASASVPTYNKDVPAVVLLDESRLSIDDSGKITRTTTYAVRILTREGRGYASGSSGYTTDQSKVKDFHAWLIYPSGNVKKYGKDEIADVAAVDNDIYNEARARVVSASNAAEVGSIFGFEATTEERDFFNQHEWEFQGHLPVVSSRYSISLPQGWKAESITFNHAKVEPAVSGSSWTWELRNLSPIEHEPASPKVTNLAPRLAVSVFPAPGAKTNARSYSSWVDVSRWMSEISDTQLDLNDALASKAQELIANAKNDFEKIQAIGRYAQNITYISIQIGLGRFRPHPAIEVFNKKYGDCKDKANLMRAMLKAVNITAWPVVIYSGDPSYVREEWPSPTQFNHCIIAVKVSEVVQAPTIVRHPKLGRLLIFDPTDDYTPVGDLPQYLQGSFALVAAGESGALLRMPVTPPETNRLERSAAVTLTPEGAITAKISENATGQSARSFRSEFKRQARPDYVKMIEGWVTRGAQGAKVTSVEPTDNQAEGRFSLVVEFTVPSYAQSMHGQLLVFKPAIVSRRESVFLTEPNRKLPVVLESQAYTETVRIRLPAGFVVDEVPDAVKLETAFGQYSAQYEVTDGQLIYTRTYVIQSGTIPVDQYGTLRSFFEKIRTAEQAPVVLAKK